MALWHQASGLKRSVIRKPTGAMVSVRSSGGSSVGLWTLLKSHAAGARPAGLLEAGLEHVHRAAVVVVDQLGTYALRQKVLGIMFKAQFENAA